MGKVSYINYNWLYKNDFNERYIDKDFDFSEFETVDLPHTNVITPYNYFNEDIYQFISCYAKKILIGSEYKGKRVFIDFEGVMIAAKVYCNGKFVCEHKGGYTPFSADITDFIKYDEQNIIVVEVDSTEREDIPPYGNVVDYLTYGGIYREVSIRVVEPVYIKNIFARTPDCLKEHKKLEVDVVIENLLDEGEYELKAVLLNDKDKIKEVIKTELISKGESTFTLKMEDINDIELWDIDNPKLYGVEVTLSYKENLIDLYKEKIGFRQASFEPDGFFINGRKVKLIGLNRHQSYPYVGYAMPERIQKKDADILKYDLGLNIVRTSHYPQSRHFLDRCDEIGLLVFEEIPGWQHIGDEKWQELAIKSVEDMIERDYNRPSIILWGVRVNESQDNHTFYTKTNEMARRLDTTRQTGGVRYMQKSEFLEDVYTINDFTHSGGKVVFKEREKVTGLEEKVPYLVTESNGHMYPTKRFDHEGKLVEHALRHLRVINEALGREDISGSISWCAFDYNTHSCFGSGDKICYHGVMDMFRQPKYASFSYASQIDSDKKVILEVPSLVSRGEKDGGGIIPFYVLTNCDYIKIYKNNVYIDKFYPDKENYPSLKHPPIQVCHLMPESAQIGLSKEDTLSLKQYIIDRVKKSTITSLEEEDFMLLMTLAQKNNIDIMKLLFFVIKVAGGWGDTANTLTIKGYIDDKEVASKVVGEEKSMDRLEVAADDTTLYTNNTSYDATRVVVKLLDNLGEIMPFTNECAEVEIDGPGEIMGPSKFSLLGGCSAFWVRTKGDKGRINIKVSTNYYEKDIDIEVK